MTSILPAKTPQMTVDIRGVLVVWFILDKNLKSKPSLAIAYKMRGSGNIAPKRLYNYNIKIEIIRKSNNRQSYDIHYGGTYLVHKANIAPPETIILITGIPKFS